MKFIYNLLAVVLCVATSLNAVPVRVLLSDDTAQGWSLSSHRGLIVKDKSKKSFFPRSMTCKTLTIKAEKDTIQINGKIFTAHQLWIEPLDGVVSYNGNEYDGHFSLVFEKSKWHLVNVLDVEEYVYSVLKTESWPGWPLEVNKAFAVACRSYVLHQLLSSEQKDAPYHIKNTNFHQTYQGLHVSDVIRKAVEETRGIFLAHKEYPILAMFDCCCGGVIPAKIADHIDFVKAPYLARSYACTFCKDSKLYRWSATYSVDQIMQMIQENRDIKVHPIKDIKVAHKDRAGLVQKVTLKTQRGGALSLKVREVYKLFKGVKSYCFSILKKGKTVTLTGKGYGHHVGMCQWGAREMVRQGSSYRDVLEFYYPETHFMKLVQSSGAQEKTVRE